ncbi:MAG: hypothetical protein JWO47_596 [Candidatus Saccharibacteria bacterium]|nr:hypothetical protein [Candidatus Saccharibacteria bacterium]
MDPEAKPAVQSAELETPQTPMPGTPIEPMLPDKKPSQKWSIIVLLVILLLLVGAYFMHKSASTPSKSTLTNASITQSTTATAKPETVAPKVEGLQLDPKKNYGNKYADGLLPVGDNKYVTDAAKKGYVYECQNNFVPASQAGAQNRGPWFTNNNTQWDVNKKSHISGSINWTQQFSVVIQNGKRIITTNDLPNHPTGVFPVAASDPARVYDGNPNTISAQTMVYSVASAPTYGSPQCMGGEVGVMLTGVALFNGFDAGGRDAGAWEVQDNCDGHPQNKGEYHYHTLSKCITDQSVKTVLGYALDGYPITGPKVGDKNFLTTDDLDECHGIVSDITLDNKTVTTYHYVMTEDFPYSASCFRATAIQPPGKPEH